MKMRVCVVCGEAYVLTSNKPGFINECGDCGLEHEVELAPVPDHLMAIGDAIGADQITEMRDYSR